MKSFFVAASAVSAVAATGLGLGLGVDIDLLGAPIDIGLGVKIQLPKGLEVPRDSMPTAAPAAGQNSVWHPEHQGVQMDGCDGSSESGWHYVHPCGDNCNTEQPSYVWTTSTVSVTSMHTVISCAPTVTNCPANGQHTVVTTVTIPETTTICPVEASSAHPSAAPSNTAAYPTTSCGTPGYTPPVVTSTRWTTYTLPAYTAPAVSSPAYSAPSESNPAYSAPSGGKTTAPVYSAPPAYSAPAAGSSPAYSAPPVYSVPCNTTTPVYGAPSVTSAYQPPAASSPATPIYSQPGVPVPYPAPTGGVPSGGNSTVPITNGASALQGLSAALFVGVLAVFFL